MSIFYVCRGFDEYDPVTGLFMFKTDCIEWNTETMGPYDGPTYATQEECYEQSIYSPNISNPTSSNNSNSLCEIQEVSLIENNNNQIKVNIKLTQQYNNAYIEYAVYDIDQNLIQNFSRLNIDSNTLLSDDNYYINISNINSSNNRGCPNSIVLSGWEAVHKSIFEPNTPPEQWLVSPDFIYQNINGRYTNLGIDAQGYAWYRSDNYGRWNYNTENNIWEYTPNIDTGSYSSYGDDYIIDRWYIAMSNEPFPITLQYAWGISFGELSDTYISTRLLAFGTPGELCPINIDLSNLTLSPSPNNINDPTKRWSGITKVGDILGEDGSGSGSESGFDICKLAFRLVSKCSKDSESGSGNTNLDCYIKLITVVGDPNSIQCRSIRDYCSSLSYPNNNFGYNDPEECALDLLGQSIDGICYSSCENNGGGGESGGGGGGESGGGGGGESGGGGGGESGGGGGGESGGGGGGESGGGGDGNTGIRIVNRRGPLLGTFVRDFSATSGQAYSWVTNAYQSSGGYAVISYTNVLFQNFFDDQTILVQPLNFPGFYYESGWKPQDYPIQMYEAKADYNELIYVATITMQAIGGSLYFVLPPNKQLVFSFGDTIYDTLGNQWGFGPYQSINGFNYAVWNWKPQI